MGGVAFELSSAGSTHNPPYEQLLIGLGVGSGLIFHIGSGGVVGLGSHVIV